MATLNETNYKKVAGIIAIIVAAGLAISLIILAICGNQLPTVTIDYAGEKQSAKIVVNGQEQDVTDQVETVEAVEVNDKEQVKIEDEEETGGQGGYFGIDATTPTTVKDSTIGNCINIDGAYGAQCWDLSAAISVEQTGRRLSTCGTGAASGMMNCASKNAGEDYDVIWDATQIRPGDILVFSGGQYGHTGMAMGYYNNGYVTLLGQNQGGGSCDQGGAATNIINISTKNFLGAYRWKGWNWIYEVHEEEQQAEEQTATEEATVEPCAVGSTISVVKGDTMGKIMYRCYGYTKWGSAMNSFAQTWVSTKVKPGQIVYDGWNTYPGVGLWAGDTIQRVK